LPKNSSKPCIVWQMLVAVAEVVSLPNWPVAVTQGLEAVRRWWDPPAWLKPASAPGRPTLLDGGRGFTLWPE